MKQVECVTDKRDGYEIVKRGFGNITFIYPTMYKCES